MFFIHRSSWVSFFSLWTIVDKLLLIFIIGFLVSVSIPLLGFSIFSGSSGWSVIVSVIPSIVSIISVPIGHSISFTSISSMLISSCSWRLFILLLPPSVLIPLSILSVLSGLSPNRLFKFISICPSGPVSILIIFSSARSLRFFCLLIVIFSSSLMQNIWIWNCHLLSDLFHVWSSIVLLNLPSSMKGVYFRIA